MLSELLLLWRRDLLLMPHFWYIASSRVPSHKALYCAISPPTRHAHNKLVFIARRIVTVQMSSRLIHRKRCYLKCDDKLFLSALYVGDRGNATDVSLEKHIHLNRHSPFSISCFVDACSVTEWITFHIAHCISLPVNSTSSRRKALDCCTPFC